MVFITRLRRGLIMLALELVETGSENVTRFHFIGLENCVLRNFVMFTKKLYGIFGKICPKIAKYTVRLIKQSSSEKAYLKDHRILNNSLPNVHVCCDQADAGCRLRS